MAKTNKDKIMQLCDSINKKDGQGSLYTVDGEYANLKINRWSTGIADLDKILGGGMPEGRIIEISGAESAGKTTLAYHLCALHDVCLDLPIEGTFDVQRAKVFGNRKGQMLIGRTTYGEDTLNKTIKFAQAGIPLICIDSVPCLIPKEDAEKVLKSADRDSIEEQRIGGTARLLNKYIPMIKDVCEETGTTLIFINQVRDKMNAMLFGEKTDTPGGRALKHYASVRIQVARKGWIEIPNKDPANSAANEKIGMVMKCKIIKNKVGYPLGECEIPLIFDRGFVSFDDIPGVRKELMSKRNAEFGKKGK